MPNILSYYKFYEKNPFWNRVEQTPPSFLFKVISIPFMILDFFFKLTLQLFLTLKIDLFKFVRFFSDNIFHFLKFLPALFLL
jgi:hypothetical protein